jgi:hypothetical protein
MKRCCSLVQKARGRVVKKFKYISQMSKINLKGTSAQSDAVSNF